MEKKGESSDYDLYCCFLRWLDSWPMAYIMGHHETDS
jgi:hypothetical protein